MRKKTLSAPTPFGVHHLRDVLGLPNCSAAISVPTVRGTYRHCYVKAIPEPYTANRLVAAWWVLTGRAYALVWPKPGDLEHALGCGLPDDRDPNWRP